MKKILLFLLSLMVFNCSSGDSSNDKGEESEWAVDRNEVTGNFNLFPLSLNPNFRSVSSIDLEDNKLVGVVYFGNSIMVFPYVYTLRHEIINTQFGSTKYVFSYCPITKSSIAFKREEIFRASGYLFNDNLTPWDQMTESIWSQMLAKGIHGPKKNVPLTTIPVLETRWKTIKDYYSSAQVLVNPLDSRFSSPPDDSNNDNDDVDLPGTGELTFGIVESGLSNVHLFKYSDFEDSKRKDVIIQGQKYIVYGNAAKRVINAYKVSSFNDYELLEDSEFPKILKANSVKYDILGKGTNGVILEKPKLAYVAAWISWQDFFEGFQFYQNE